MFTLLAFGILAMLVVIARHVSDIARLLRDREAREAAARDGANAIAGSEVKNDE